MPVPFGGGGLFAGFDPAAQARLRGGSLGGGTPGGGGGAATGAGQPPGAGGAAPAATPGAAPTPNPHQGAVSLTPGQSPLSYNGTDVAGQWNYGGAVSNPFRPTPRPQGAGAGGPSPTPTPTPNPHDTTGAGAGAGAGGDNSLLLGSPNPAATGQQVPQLFAGGGKAGIGAGMQPQNPYQRPANVAGGKGGGGGGPAPGPGGGGGGAGGEVSPPAPDITIDKGNSPANPIGNQGAGPIPTTTNPKNAAPFSGLPPGGTNVPYDPNRNVVNDRPPNVTQTYNPKTGKWEPVGGAAGAGGAGPIPTTTNPKNAAPFSGLPPGGTNAPYDPNRNVVNDRPANVTQTFNPKTGQWVPVPGINSANTQGPPPGPATTTNPPGGGPFAGLPPGGTTGTIGPNGAPAQNAAANPLADLARMLGLGRMT